MNLADAIRRASHGGSGPTWEETLTASDERLEPKCVAEDIEPEADHDDLSGGSLSLSDQEGMVRLELFLGPEQLHRLIRSVVATQHSVLTLREAASFLRMTSASVEALAKTRQIPAFQADGKWRFSKARLEEWLASHWDESEAS